jgi:RNA polymerase sigma-70 factor (ECF subfamily)
VDGAAAADGGAAARAAEDAARRSYGRLLAYLAYRWRDIAGAEDALADAFAAALTAWPRDGVPDSPEAWLMTAARRKLLEMARHRRVTEDPAVTVLLGGDEAQQAGPEQHAFPDERLKLMFVCAHPAIAPEMHAALMLQTVLGLQARQIAAAFLVAPSALAQRLVRAKAKIRDAGLRFEEPEPAEWPARVHAVLEAIYAAYGLGWDGAALGEAEAPELAGEALYLAQLTLRLLRGKGVAGGAAAGGVAAGGVAAGGVAAGGPAMLGTAADRTTARAAEAEAAGLAALLLFCEARRGARSTQARGFVPLHEQDTALWDHAMIAQAEQTLREAAAMRAPGRFQLEAAIQSAHSQRAVTGRVPWEGIALLYAELRVIAPTVGALVGQAVAEGEARGAAAGLDLLARIDDAALRDYQPFWAAKGYLLARQGERAAAQAAYLRAAGLTALPGPRDYLLARAAEMAER